MKLKIEITDFNTETKSEYEIGFIWGIGAFEIFEDNTGMDQFEMHRGVLTGNQKILCNLAYAAAQLWYEMTTGDNTLPFTYRQFQYWLSNAEQGTGDKISKDFLASAYEGQTMTSYYEGILKSISKQEGSGETKKKSRSVKSS